MGAGEGEQGDGTPANPADRAFRSTVGRESTTFGFSILVTVTFGVVKQARGSPDTVDLLLYASGAVISFTLLEAIFSRGFRAPMPQHSARIIARGTALNIVSVLGGVGAALVAAALIDGPLAWPVCPFVAGLVYLSLESAEVIVAEAIARRRGEPDAEELSR